MAKFLYLIQGSKEKCLRFNSLQTKFADLIVLTYDHKIADHELNCLRSLHLPNSTWSEGRNFQINIAKSLSSVYDYYIFLDDDVLMAKGDFVKFQKLLIEYKPGVGLPLCDLVKNSNYYLSNFPVQRPIAIDQLVQAFSCDFFFNSILLPYITEFDDISWWYSCEINSYLILKYHIDDVLQFNEIEVINGNHDWDAQNPFSSYKAGTTDKGLNEIKIYIENKFGFQQKLLNSIFRSDIFPRYLYTFSFIDALKHAKNIYFLEYSLKRVVYYLFKYISHIPFRILNLVLYKNKVLPIKID